MTRIAYVCADPGVPVFGHKGCSVHVQEMVRAFQRHGARVDLFATRADGTPPPELAGLRVHRLPAVRTAAPGIPAVHELNRALAVGLTEAGPYDMVYERFSLWSAAAMEHARAAGVPGLLEVNAPLIEEQAEHRALRDARGAAALAERVFAAATALLAVSAEVAAWLARYPAARGRVHLVPNGVDPERFRPDVPPAMPAPPGTFTVGFVGSMKRWHGLHRLIDAFALLHERVSASRLLMVGDGPEQAEAQADLARRAGGLAEAAHFTGSAAARDVPALLTSMDAAVAPYPDAKGFYFSPLKVYEYLASGRAVVASRVGQVAAMIEHEVNGLLCPPGDAAALAAALERLHGDPPLRARLGQAARASALEHQSWEARAATIMVLARVAPAQRRSGQAVEA
ncbi:MAG TPA: glycosyltransferase family 4 protein [Gemmatimonadales bacterium]|nr:glycosyltransferase family 4 protein [Gemmatimonadales bacterium]